MKSLVLSGLFVALIALGAFINIPVPLVPFTLQYLFTMLAGLLLGPRQGFVTFVVYILLGLVGFPVFAQGGGLGYILKPSFGYLLGFALGALVTGSISGSSQCPSHRRLLLSNLCGLAVVYGVGLSYYYLISHFYLQEALGLWPLLLYGLILAIPGDLVLCVVGAILAKRLLPIYRKDVLWSKG